MRRRLTGRGSGRFLPIKTVSAKRHRRFYVRNMNGPVVRLIDATRTPYDLSIASARTCYSSKGIIYPEDVSATPKAVELRDRIARSTLQAGHLTTRQHPHFIFTIDNVSRHLVWCFLHSHPFYNSEQVSQRYVEVKADRYHVPSSLDRDETLRALYLQVMQKMTEAYFELIRLLEPEAERIFYSIFPARRKSHDRWKNTIHKKAMETARYVLPVATHTYLYHTINGLTLHRYRRMAQASDVPREAKDLVDAMWFAVCDHDPLYAAEMRDSLPLEETTEYRFFNEFFGGNRSESLGFSGSIEKQISKQFVREFDETLQGRIARLCGSNAEAVRTLGASVRAVLGMPSSALSDAEAMALLLDPARNRHLGSTLNESTMSRLTRSLYNVQFTYQKKISHTADSQDQRHRTVPASRPVLMRQFTGDVDAIVPELIEQCEPARQYYNEQLADLFRTIVRFLDAGGTEEEAVYLLPNAFPIRFYESGDLLNLHHKWKARTCYNAQEEIFRASVEELDQAAVVLPGLTDWLRAPCYLRKRSGERPFCPEGDRFCGIPVWNQELSEYRRVL